MVSRRKVLQGIMSLAASPVMPRSPILEVAEVFSSAALPKILNTDFQGALHVILEDWGQACLYLDDMMSDPKWREHSLWVSVNSLSDLIQVSLSKDWYDYLDPEDLRDLQPYTRDGRLVDFSVFSDRNTLSQEMERFVSILANSETDMLSKAKIKIGTDHFQTLQFYHERCESFSKNDIRFLAEMEFLEKHGFRANCFSLTPEHDHILSILERHPLVRASVANARISDDFYMTKDFSAAFNRPTFDPHRLLDEEISYWQEAYRRYEEQLTEKELIYGHGYGLDFSDLERTIDSPDDFMDLAIKRCLEESSDRYWRYRVDTGEDDRFKPYSFNAEAYFLEEWKVPHSSVQGLIIDISQPEPFGM